MDITLGASGLIRENDLERASKVQGRLILRSGQSLYFRLNDTNPVSEDFVVRLRSDLVMVKKGLKPSLVNNCECEVIGRINESGGFKPLEIPIKANSLNQAYSQSYIKFRPNSNSHTCNVYATFRTEKDEQLELLKF